MATTTRVHPVTTDEDVNGASSSTEPTPLQRDKSRVSFSLHRSSSSGVGGIRAPSPSKVLSSYFSRSFSRSSLQHESSESSDEPSSPDTARKRRVAAAFSRSFRAPSRQQSSASSDGLSEPSFRSFQKISDAEQQQPRSFVEFYKVLTHGDREGHAFFSSDVDPLGFSETTNRLRKRLRKANFMLLSPSSRQMQYWDFYMLVLLLCARRADTATRTRARPRDSTPTAQPRAGVVSSRHRSRLSYARARSRCQTPPRSPRTRSAWCGRAWG